MGKSIKKLGQSLITIGATARTYLQCRYSAFQLEPTFWTFMMQNRCTILKLEHMLLRGCYALGLVAPIIRVIRLSVEVMYILADQRATKL